MKKKRSVGMILTVLLFVCQILPVYASEERFTPVSALMEAMEDMDALESPNEDAAVVTSFQQGEPILVTGESNDGWYRTTFQGNDCYIKKEQAKTAAQVEGEALQELNKELNLQEQENRIIVEEVERVREEQRHSMIWSTVIVTLIVVIFLAGIYSTIKANRKDKEAALAEKKEETERLN